LGIFEKITSWKNKEAGLITLEEGPLINSTRYRMFYLLKDENYASSEIKIGICADGQHFHLIKNGLGSIRFVEESPITDCDGSCGNTRMSGFSFEKELDLLVKELASPSQKK